MRILSTNLLASVKQNFRKKTTYKIYRKTDTGWKIIDNVQKADAINAIQGRKHNDEVHEQRRQNGANHDEIKSSNGDSDQGRPNYRQNEMKIQMLSQPLYEQIFKNTTQNQIDERKIRRFLDFDIHFFPLDCIVN